MGPYREAPVSRAFFYTFPSKSPVNDPPSPCSPTGSIRREKLHLQIKWFVHLYLAESPIRSPPIKNGENIWSPSTEPHVDGRPTFNGVRPGSQRGSFTTLQFLPRCHAALSTIPSTLAWVDQSPFSQHVS
jgi:hypothetical protein